MREGTAGNLESPRGVAWPREVPSDAPSRSPSPDHKGQQATGQGPVPCNYAYDEDEGYSNMLLYKLSPRLAEVVYPIIATRAVEAFVTVVLVLGMAVSLPPLINRDLPGEMTFVSFIMYIPAVHRLSLVHTRRFLLLLRQFELWCVIHMQ